MASQGSIADLQGLRGILPVFRSRDPKAKRAKELLTPTDAVG